MIPATRFHPEDLAPNGPLETHYSALSDAFPSSSIGDFFDAGSRHRFRCAHADRLGCARRLRRNAWRDAGRLCDLACRRAIRLRPGPDRGRHSRLRPCGGIDRIEYRMSRGPARGAVGDHCAANDKLFFCGSDLMAISARRASLSMASEQRSLAASNRSARLLST